MIENILNKIKEKRLTDRDLYVDDLSSLLESEQLSSSDEIRLVEELLELLKEESNVMVIESIFNFMSIAFSSDIRAQEIAKISAQLMKGLAPGSLVHAISIIGFSEMENRKKLIAPYLRSQNSAVRLQAEEILNKIEDSK